MEGSSSNNSTVGADYLGSLNKWREKAAFGENRQPMYTIAEGVHAARGTELTIDDPKLTDLMPIPPSVTLLNMPITQSAILSFPQDLFDPDTNATRITINTEVEHLNCLISCTRTNGYAGALLLLGDKSRYGMSSYIGSTRSAYYESLKTESPVCPLAWIYFEKAAAAGYIKSYGELNGILQSPDLARGYLDQAARLGITEAYKELSLITQGYGDVEEASEAALYNHIIAESSKSPVGKADVPVEFIQSLRAKADQKNGKAAYELAKILKAQQKESSSPDYREVKKYLKIAVKFSSDDQELHKKALEALNGLPKKGFFSFVHGKNKK